MSELEDEFAPILEDQEAEPDQTDEPIVAGEEGAPVVADAPVVEEEAVKAEPAQTVPLATYLDERERRKAAESMTQRPVQPEPQALPDVLEDPEGYARALAMEAQNVALNARLDVSEVMARETHGDETVNAALAAAQEAGVIGQFTSKKHAYGELVKWHNTQLAAAEIGDPTTYKERVKAQVMAELQAEQTAKAIKDAPSIAHETSVGGRIAAAPAHTPLEDLL